MSRLVLLLVVVATLASVGCGDPSCPPGYALNATKTMCVTLDAGTDAGSDAGAAPDACTPTTETCNGRDDDCDGVIDGPAAATACGAGAVNESAAMCTAGACAYACESGYLDCTTTPGCETHADVDASNCGACGHVCAWGSCNAGACNDAVEIGAGGNHTCARRADGSVVCWGGNLDGEIGDGTLVSRSVPTIVPGVARAVAVGAGQHQSAAILADGSLFAWGSNVAGSLGDGGAELRSSVPVFIAGMPNARQAVSGAQSACGRDSAGMVWCWGDGSYGQSGDGSGGHSTPHANRVSGVVGIAEGGDAICALTSTGTIECWGDGRYGQIGDGTATHDSCFGDDCATMPRFVAGPTAVEMCVGGGFACSRAADGRVRCWGSNNYGQLGDGVASHATACSVGDCALAPVLATALIGTTSITCGGAHACALRGDHTVVCWGLNSSGQLGDGTSGHESCGALDCSHLPIAVAGLSDAVEVAAGDTHTCARRSGGAIVCWGSNSGGQLGDGRAVHTSCATSDCAGTFVTVTLP